MKTLMVIRLIGTVFLFTILSLSSGIAAQLWSGPPPLIQITAANSSVSSGGRLFDGEELLVGLTPLYVEGWKRLNFAVPLVWISEVRPGVKQVSESIDQTEWLKRVVALEKMNDWQGLVALCRNWTESEPGNANAWFFLGFYNRRGGGNDNVIELYRKALRLNPDHPGASIGLGGEYGELNRHNDAMEA